MCSRRPVYPHPGESMPGVGIGSGTLRNHTAPCRTSGRGRWSGRGGWSGRDGQGAVPQESAPVTYTPIFGASA